jgi:hypothetical protein
VSVQSGVIKYKPLDFFNLEFICFKYNDDSLLF